MSVLETLLRFAVPTVVLYLLIVLAVVGRGLARRPRYRVGQPWSYEPIWWTADPEEDAHHHVVVRSASGERGGAHGGW